MGNVRPLIPERLQHAGWADGVAAMTQAKSVVMDRTFSPAELTAALAESLVHGADGGHVPDALPRRRVLGPVSRPVLARELDLIESGDLIGLCRQVAAAVGADGHLPANVTTPAARVGIAQFAALAARAYRAAARCEQYQRLRVPELPRCPEPGWQLDAFIRRYIGEHWAYDLEFTPDRLAEHARLQCWTLKPAWLCPPRGRPISEGRMPA